MCNNLVREDKYQNYLLVEGKDDRYVFHHLLDYHQILGQFKIKDEHFEIKEHGGIDNLLDAKTLETYLKVDAPRRFGIVVDADIDLEARWRRLRAKLEKFGYHNIPIKPRTEGTLLKEEGKPVVGIWLMPDNKITGMLEDFIKFLIPPNDLLWPMAEEIVQKVKTIETDIRFRGIHEMKARIHTWLAWQKKPGTPIGQAITVRYLDANTLLAQQLIGWIRELFELGSV